MKRYISLILVVLFLFCGCVPREGSDTTAETTNVTETASVEVDESLSYEQFFPVFTATSIDGGYARYKNVTTEMLNSYIESLCEDGFECKRNLFNALLYKDDVMIYICDATNSSGSCSVEIRIAKKADSQGALSLNEAMNVIDDDRIFFLIEQTPEGFYEKTGAQYYYFPVHHFDYYENFSEIPENGGYTFSKCIVSHGGKVFVDNNISEPVICDINNDGINDIICLGYGPTSGLFTITLTMINVIDGVPKVVTDACFTLPHGQIDLKVNSEGKPIVVYAANDKEPQNYEILIKDNSLYFENALLFRGWGYTTDFMKETQ